MCRFYLLNILMFTVQTSFPGRQVDDCRLLPSEETVSAMLTRYGRTLADLNIPVVTVLNVRRAVCDVAALEAQLAAQLAPAPIAPAPLRPGDVIRDFGVDAEGLATLAALRLVELDGDVVVTSRDNVGVVIGSLGPIAECAPALHTTPSSVVALARFGILRTVMKGGVACALVAQPWAMLAPDWSSLCLLGSDVADVFGVDEAMLVNDVLSAMGQTNPYLGAYLVVPTVAGPSLLYVCRYGLDSEMVPEALPLPADCQ